MQVTEYEPLMHQALLLAQTAAKTGEIPVGAIVVDVNGKLLGTGFNTREDDHDPMSHAEVVAMRAAAKKLGNWRLDDCTLVVTLEPCTMCAGTAMQARIKKIVFGAFDEKAGAVGSLWDVVRDPRLPHRAEVISGVLAQECAQLLGDFFKSQRR